jgi:hypothetical protein
MSSIAYGILNANRARASAGKSQAEAAPAMKTYVDTLAALVPAEALALYAGVVVPNVTGSYSVHGRDSTVISDPGLLGWSCAALLVLSAVLYAVGRIQKNVRLTRWDAAKCLIPPTAFAAWMLVQAPGVWDTWWPALHPADRVVIAAFAAVALGIVTTVLGKQVDAAPAVLPLARAGPAARPAAAGPAVDCAGPATATVAGPVAGPAAEVVIGPVTAPAAEPATEVVAGPVTAAVAGPAAAAVIGPVTAPAAEPGAAVVTGPAMPVAGERANGSSA